MDDLTKKNEFLFEEIAKDKLRFETRIQTLLERLEKQSKVSFIVFQMPNFCTASFTYLEKGGRR